MDLRSPSRISFLKDPTPQSMSTKPSIPVLSSAPAAASPIELKALGILEQV